MAFLLYLKRSFVFGSQSLGGLPGDNKRTQELINKEFEMIQRLVFLCKRTIYKEEHPAFLEEIISAHKDYVSSEDSFAKSKADRKLSNNLGILFDEIYIRNVFPVTGYVKDIDLYEELDNILEVLSDLEIKISAERNEMKFHKIYKD